MAEHPTCLRCKTPMEEGFLLDSAHAGLRQARWCVGTPQPSFWNGEVQSHQFVHARKVTTFRCPTCGYLESYALESSSRLDSR
jgi:hypothetical protein